MNAKHLFLTLAAVVCSAMSMAETFNATDVISTSNIVAKGYNTSIAGAEQDWYNAVEEGSVLSNWKFASDARYATSMFYCDTDDGIMGIYEHSFATTATGGNVKSVTISWLNNDEWNDGAFLDVYVSTSPFTGVYGENEDALGAKSTYVTTFVYGDGETTVTVPSGFQFVAFVSRGEGGYLTQIRVEWEWEVLSKYKVSAGTITEGTWGTNVKVTPAEALTDGVEENTEITVTFIPKKKTTPPAKAYSLVSYGFDDMIFDLSCGAYPTNPNKYTITFPMPARDVQIDATFAYMPKTNTLIVFSESAPTTVQSGVGIDIDFTFVNKTTKELITGYDGAITAKVSSDYQDNMYVDAPVKVSDGNYKFKVHGLLSGSAQVVLTASEQGQIGGTTANITFTVEPRQTAFISEVDGRYFVAKNTLSGSQFEAIEVYKHGDHYLYQGSFDPAAVTWYVSTLNSDGSEYSVQNASDQFLAPTGLNFKFQNEKYTWYDDAGRYIETKNYNYISYNTSTSKFAMAGYTTAAVDVLLSSFYPMTYSTSSTADVGIVDSRSIKNTYGTICVPFDIAAESVSSSNAKFYTLDSKVITDGKLSNFILSEPHTALVAGHSYIYEMESGKNVIDFTGSGAYLYNAVDIADDGLVGCLAKDKDAVNETEGVLTVPYNTPKVDGCFILYQNKMRYVNIYNQTVKAFRAYIDASEISTGTPAPGRRMLVCDKTGDDEVITAIVDVPEAMLINWDEPVYNIMGMRVGKGATGVLIQNGQKFFVE